MATSSKICRGWEVGVFVYLHRDWWTQVLWALRYLGNWPMEGLELGRVKRNRVQLQMFCSLLKIRLSVGGALGLSHVGRQKNIASTTFRIGQE